MKRVTLTVMVLAISVIFVAAVMAAEQKAPGSAASAPKAEKFKGVVEKVDEVKKDILVKSEKEEMIFSLTDRTKITEGNKELTFADLKNGSSVTVRYKKEGDKLVALRISVHMPKTTGMKEKTPSERAY
jgi:Cu/Ag efflux protein CusF